MKNKTSLLHFVYNALSGRSKFSAVKYQIPFIYYFNAFMSSIFLLSTLFVKILCLTLLYLQHVVLFVKKNQFYKTFLICIECRVKIIDKNFDGRL